MSEFEVNPQFASLGKVGKGDIVHLKLNDAFEYLVKVIILDVGSAGLGGTVDAEFDWHNHGQLTHGDTFKRLSGKHIQFKPHHVHHRVPA